MPGNMIRDEIRPILFTIAFKALVNDEIKVWPESLPPNIFHVSKSTKKKR